MVAMVVGSYTRQRPFFREVGRGLSLLEFDAERGSIAAVDVLETLPSPAYVRPHKSGFLTVCEEPEGEAALAYVAVESGKLVLAGTVPVPGDTPCHVDIDPSGDWAATACYGSGHVTVHALDRQGVPSEAVSVELHEGSSMNPTRQTGPHAHAARFSPDGAWLLVADLGTDHVWCHRLSEGRMYGEAELWQAPLGSGPRMLSFAPDGRHVMVVLELTSQVTSLRWEDGSLRRAGLTSTLMGWNDEDNTASGLRWHKSTTLFAVSNRGADRITLFRVNYATGEISAVSEVPSGGAKPRDFEFSPCGRWLIVANQDSHSLAVFSVDGEKLVDTGTRFPIGCPSCVRFL